MMKKISIWLLAVLLVGASSCEKFLDVNENPNSPTTAPINGLLAQTTYQTALDVYRAGSLITNYVQYFASPNPASSSDIYETIDASGSWTSMYNTMTDIYDLGELGRETGSSDHEGVAKIMMAINLKLVHDLWGDAPYTEAFSAETLTPAFDDAQSLFQRCMTLLDEGIALLQQGNSTYELSSTLDLIHGGDKDAWIKTAYALKARFMTLLTKTGSYDPDAVLAALSNAYTSNADNAAVSTFDVRNPWASVALNNANLVLGGFLSDQYVKMMDGTYYGIFDPRLPLIGTMTKFNDYRGTVNGEGRVGTGIDQEESYLSTTGYYSSTSSPLAIITYAETKFIEAEAYFRKSDPADAYAAYLEGIQASMDELGVSSGDAATYLASGAVSVGSGSLTLADIFREKYKALFLNPETWNDARRFDYQYENFMMPTGAVLPNFIRRLDYPSVETSRNGKNVPSVSSLDEKLWWDQ